MKLEINNPLAIVIWNNAQLMKQNDFVAWLLDESESPSQSKETPVAGLEELENMVKERFKNVYRFDKYLLADGAGDLWNFLKPHLSSLLEKKDERIKDDLATIVNQSQRLIEKDFEIESLQSQLAKPSEQSKEIKSAEEILTATIRAINPDWDYGDTDEHVFQQFWHFFDPSPARHRIIKAMHEYAEQGKQAVNEDELWREMAVDIHGYLENPHLSLEGLMNKLKQTYSITKK